jgi:Methane oxygenase PmoA
MHFHFFKLAVLILLAAATASTAKITVERSNDGATVKIDGQLFVEYRTLAGHGPALYPVIGPTGKPVTRTYPFGPPGETNDHPHHQSFWMTHGLVNDVDFWRTDVNDNVGEKGPHIAHREFLRAESDGDVGKIATRNDWMDGDKRCCEDERDLTFGVDPDGSRWIDFTLTIRAPDEDVTFGDTKEGAFALRVVDSMRVDAKTGGHIVNSEGLTNEDAWGMPARWVDYTGPVDGETVGITILAHPTSFRPKQRWHVRTYGLFAANPFGQKEFPHPEAAEQGSVTVKKGESLMLRYRVWIHKGSVDASALEREFATFSK